METSAHIDNIRNFIRDGQRPEQSVDGRQYLDSVAYWRAKYLKSLEVENEIRARVLELEAMLEAHTDASSRTTQRAVVSNSRETKGGATVATKKRKRGGAFVADTVDDRATNLTRTTESSEGLHVNNFSPALLDIDLDLDEERHVNRLFDHMYRIRSAIKGGESGCIKAEELKHLVIQTAADTCHVISSVQTLTAVHAEKPPRARRPTVQAQEDGADIDGNQLIADTDTKCVAVARFFPLLLNALATLPDTKSYRGEAIYSLTSIFRDLLERICSLSASKAQQGLLKGPPRKARTTRGRLLAEISDYLPEPRQDEFTTGKEDDRVIKKLCQLAFSIMDRLDPNDSTEKEVFESFLYFLLTRVGELVKEFVFNHEALDIPRYTEGEERRAKQEAQAPYLIYLLKHATTVTARQFGLDTPCRKACNSISLSQGEKKGARGVLTKARLILQHTMLKAVYDEEADEFVESLKKPLETCDNSCLNSGPSEIDGKMQTTSEWFKAEVWETVGWDLLYDMIEIK